jgi:hypothetical protein
LRLLVEGALKFVPLYVGISERPLVERLHSDHYNLNKSGGKGKKELWDFSMSRYSTKDIYSRYSQMYHYDYLFWARKNRKSQKYLSELLFLDHLIFFQNNNYFALKNGMSMGLHYNLDHLKSLTVYPSFAKEIINTKSNYDKNFYFVYASLDDITDEKSISSIFDMSILKHIELSVKKALNSLGIHTTASTEKDAKKIKLDIDFSKIKSCLVNMETGLHTLDNFDNELLISLRP